VKLRVERLPLRTRRQFVISRAAYVEHVNVLVTLASDDGIVGYGEAAPNKFYDESAESALAAAGDLAPLLTEAGHWDLTEVDDRLYAALPAAASLRAAVSSALHDIHGKRVGAPLHRIWGLDVSRAPLSSFTIAIAGPAELRERVLEAADYPILKIKLGTDRDEEILRTVRDAAPGKRLFVDANAAWSAERAARMVELLAAAGVELVEQPVAREDVEGLAFVRARSAIPVIADESCATSADIPRLAGAVDGINIKLAKCGGLGEARRMVDAARAHGLAVMAGCMIESSLGISSIAQLAPLLDYADLDGAALLAEDPFTGVRMDAGRLVFSDEPGLGARPRTDMRDAVTYDATGIQAVSG
jgi:L-alanine-DL-glutamate epimerase-like enolase superfamily enzyme